MGLYPPCIDQAGAAQEPIFCLRGVALLLCRSVVRLFRPHAVVGEFLGELLDGRPTFEYDRYQLIYVVGVEYGLCLWSDILVANSLPYFGKDGVAHRSIYAQISSSRHCSFGYSLRLYHSARCGEYDVGAIATVRTL